MSLPLWILVVAGAWLVGNAALGLAEGIVRGIRDYWNWKARS